MKTSDVIQYSKRVRRHGHVGQWKDRCTFLAAFFIPFFWQREPGSKDLLAASLHLLDYIYST